MPLLATPAANTYIGPYDPKLMANVTTVQAAITTTHFARLGQPILRPVTVTAAYFRVGTQNGNILFELWSSDGTNFTRLGTTGSFACPAAGNRSQALTAGVTLVPGVDYYATFGADGTTAAIGGVTAITSFSAKNGIRPEGDIATAFPLASGTQLVSDLGGNVRGFVYTFE